MGGGGGASFALHWGPKMLLAALVRSVSFSTFSAIFLLDFGSVTTVGHLFCFILFMHITDYKYQEFDVQTQQEFEIPNDLLNHNKYN
jgi:hypothetical protein